VTVGYELGTHCGVRILGKLNGQWWRASEALSVRSDWFPDEWALDPTTYGEPIVVNLILDAKDNTIVATYRGRAVAYVPGRDLEDWEYCA
jgi:hypothetical protein